MPCPPSAPCQVPEGTPEDTPEDMDPCPVKYFNVVSDQSNSPERPRQRAGLSYAASRSTSMDWYTDDIRSEGGGYEEEPPEHACEFAPTPTLVCTRPRGRSMPAQSRYSDNEHSIERRSRVGLQGVGADFGPVHLAEEFVQAQRALQQECAQLRQNQVVCLQAVRETASMVVEMGRAAEREREARKVEAQEKLALQDDLRTVTTQMAALTQGQAQLQQCMMAMCAQMGATMPQQAELPAPSSMPAICQAWEDPEADTAGSNTQHDRQSQGYPGKDTTPVGRSSVDGACAGLEHERKRWQQSRGPIKDRPAAISSPAGAPSPLQPGHWQRTACYSKKAEKRAPSRPAISATDEDGRSPLRQVAQLAAMCVEGKSDRKPVEQPVKSTFF